MNVLLVGATSPVGQRLCKLLRNTGRVTLVCAAADADPARGQVRLDLRNEDAVREAVRGMQAVVHCTDGGGAALVQATGNLVRAATAANCGRIVHVGSQGAMAPPKASSTSTPRPAAAPAPGARRNRNWSASAPRAAPRCCCAPAASGAPAAAPGPSAWPVAARRPPRRPGRARRRLVEPGPHRRRLRRRAARAATAAAAGRVAHLQPGRRRQPALERGADRPGLAIGATPVRRVHPVALRLHAWTDPVAVALQRATKAGTSGEPLTPALLSLWRSQLRLDPRAAMADLKIDWTPYSVAMQEVAAWLGAHEEVVAPPLALPQGS
jgi:hypothetical protein